jgi:hypothetical protein
MRHEKYATKIEALTENRKAGTKKRKLCNANRKAGKNVKV